MSGRRREMPTLSPFEGIAERDDAEIGRCRIRPFTGPVPNMTAGVRLAMNRVYDLFDKLIILRVECADG